MLELQGEKIVLKEFSKANLEDSRYFGWLRDLDVVNTIYRLEYLLPLQFSEVEKYVHLLWESKNDCYFAVYTKDNDEFIGTQRIGHIDWRSGIGDVGIMIGEKKYWGKGLSKDIIKTACVYAFNNLSLRKLTAGTPETNISMCKCFISLGFREEGSLREQLLMNGKYVNHILFGLLAKEFIF